MFSKNKNILKYSKLMRNQLNQCCCQCYFRSLSLQIKSTLIKRKRVSLFSKFIPFNSRKSFSSDDLLKTVRRPWDVHVRHISPSDESDKFTLLLKRLFSAKIGCEVFDVALRIEQNE